MTKTEPLRIPLCKITELKPDDILVLKTTTRLTQHGANIIRADILKSVKNKLIILDPGADISVLKKSELCQAETRNP